jgi:hypothetical protein
VPKLIGAAHLRERLPLHDAISFADEDRSWLRLSEVEHDAAIGLQHDVPRDARAAVIPGVSDAHDPTGFARDDPSAFGAREIFTDVHTRTAVAIVAKVARHLARGVSQGPARRGISPRILDAELVALTDPRGR